jgi:hypothetical protein
MNRFMVPFKCVIEPRSSVALSVDSGYLIRGRNVFFLVFLYYLCVTFGCAMLIL